MSWLTQDTPGGCHVIPLEDSVEHKESPGCVCCPRVIHQGVKNHWPLYVRKLVIHEAMDGRAS